MSLVAILLSLAALFLFIYTAVRLAVTHAIRNTVRADLLLPEPETRPFQLDAGDEA